MAAIATVAEAAIAMLAAAASIATPPLSAAAASIVMLPLSVAIGMAAAAAAATAMLLPAAAAATATRAVAEIVMEAGRVIATPAKIAMEEGGRREVDGEMGKAARALRPSLSYLTCV